MSPKAPIVDCGPFCAVGFLRTMDKSEFSHSLDPKRTSEFAIIGAPGFSLKLPESCRATEVERRKL